MHQSTTYKGVLDSVKRNAQAGNGPTRASFEVAKKFGGLENIPSQYLVQQRSQVFEEKNPEIIRK